MADDLVTRLAEKWMHGNAYIAEAVADWLREQAQKP